MPFAKRATRDDCFRRPFRTVEVDVRDRPPSQHERLAAVKGDHERGVKHPLGLWDGSTENATIATTLLANLVERGLDVEQGVLVVVDGARRGLVATASRERGVFAGASAHAGETKGSSYLPRK
jgi:hypothetical protein